MVQDTHVTFVNPAHWFLRTKTGQHVKLVEWSSFSSDGGFASAGDGLPTGPFELAIPEIAAPTPTQTATGRKIDNERHQEPP